MVCLSVVSGLVCSVMVHLRCLCPPPTRQRIFSGGGGCFRPARNTPRPPKEAKLETATSPDSLTNSWRNPDDSKRAGIAGRGGVIGVLARPLPILAGVVW